MVVIIIFLNNTTTNIQHFSSFEDYGILKNYNRNYNVDTLRAEIHPLQMIGLLNFLKSKYPPYPLTKTNVETEPDYYSYYYTKIKEKIVNLITKVACGMADDTDIEIVSNLKREIDLREKKAFRKIQNKNNFVVKKEELNKIFISEDKSTLTYHFTLQLYREPADIGFNIYFEISINVNNEAFYLNGFKILGVVDQQNIVFEYSPSKTLDECSYDSMPSFECNSLSHRDPEFIKQKNEFLNQSLRNKAFDSENNLYKCFGKEEAQNKIECESWEIKNNNPVKPGIWGKRKCTIDEECPFYKSNKNYKNSRGGCIDGVCEVPINIRLLTPTIADPDSRALCHNCKPSECSGVKCSECCLAQIYYSGLKSPDYAFENDFNERMENKEEFENKGYSPFKLSF